MMMEMILGTRLVTHYPQLVLGQDRVSLPIFAAAGHQEETLTPYLTWKIITNY